VCHESGDADPKWWGPGVVRNGGVKNRLWGGLDRETGVERCAQDGARN